MLHFIGGLTLQKEHDKVSLFSIAHHGINDLGPFMMKYLLISVLWAFLLVFVHGQGPVFNDQTFEVSESSSIGAEVGVLIATDPEGDEEVGHRDEYSCPGPPGLPQVFSAADPGEFLVGLVQPHHRSNAAGQEHQVTADDQVVGDVFEAHE